MKPLIAALCLFVPLPLFGQFVYVANPNNDTVSGYAINTITGSLAPVPGSPFASGRNPRSLAVDSTGKFVYVVQEGDNNVAGYAINANTGALSPIPGSPFPAGRAPLYVAVDPKDRFAYVADFDDQAISVYTIDAGTGALTPGPSMPLVGAVLSLAVDPAGRFLYSTDEFGPGMVTEFMIDQTTGALRGISSVVTGGLAESVAVNPSGEFVYVTNQSDLTGFAINAGTGPLVPVPGSPFAAQSAPTFVASDPAGKFLYVVNAGSDSISAYTIDAATGALTATAESAFPTELRPISMAVDSTGRFAYVGYGGVNNISGFTVNATTGALTPVPGTPFAADGNTSGAIGITPVLKVAFAKFEVRDLDIACDGDSDKDDMRFNLSGEFTPGLNSNGIDPVHQAVTLTLGNFSLSIPAGSFKSDHDNDDFRFRGSVSRANVKVEIQKEEHTQRRHDAPEFQFRVEGTAPGLNSGTNPLVVTLTIANNTGSETVKSGRECNGPRD